MDDEAEDRAAGVEDAKPEPEPALSDKDEANAEAGDCCWSIRQLLWLGRSAYDAWFTASTTQIAQVLLTFPFSFAQMGQGAGICFQLAYATIGYWACYAMTCLYTEYKTTRSGRSRGREQPNEAKHMIQWFEVLGGLLGPCWKVLALTFSTVYLFTGATIQLIACGSNVYYLDNRLEKRTWTFIFGACCGLTILIPSTYNYRLWSFMGITMTSYTAWYLTAAALLHGQDKGVTHTGPHNYVQYFTGATNMLYAFGGHAVSVEIMEAMWKPKKYKFVYFLVVLYTLTLTLPSAASVYWAFGDKMLVNPNAFAVLPRTKFRDAAVVLMIIHQFIEFGLISLPIYFMWEKFLGVHQSRYTLRVVSRLPVVFSICFLAVMIPFFGPINSTVGAFLASISVYIIPCAAHMFYYRKAYLRKYAVEKVPTWFPGGWVTIYCLNLGTVLWVFVVGTCLGGWASISNFLRDVHAFGLFAKCYQCPKHKL